MMKKKLSDSEINALGLVKDNLIETLRAITELEKFGTINRKQYENIENSIKDVFELMQLNDIVTPMDDLVRIIKNMRDV